MKEGGRRAAAGYVCGPIPNPLPRRGGAAVVFLEKHLRRLDSESIAASAIQRVSKTFVLRRLVPSLQYFRNLNSI